jgi:nucleotide-binding universal stress UspA family protein
VAKERKSRTGIIVVPWDGSPAAATAFPVARILATQFRANVQIVHFLPAGAGDEVVRAAAREQGLGGFDESSLRIHSADAASGILEAAADAAVQLLVLTTHGRAIEEGRRLGHVAEHVIAHTTAPILLVRPEAPTMKRKIERLLLPVDGTPRTATALQPATDLAAKLGARIDLLYVAPGAGDLPREPGSITAPRYVDQKHHEWPSWAQEVVERLAVACAGCPPEVPVEMYLAHDGIGSEIQRFAVEHGSDAVVLVRRSRLQRGRARILRAVLDNTPCPVLICSGTDAD